MKTLYTLEDAKSTLTNIEKDCYDCRNCKPNKCNCDVAEVWAISKPVNATNLWWRIKASIQVLKGRGVPVEWF